jgi:hypothetical protein
LFSVFCFSIIQDYSRIVEELRRSLLSLSKDHTARKFRHDPEALDSTFARASQYSLFASQKDEDVTSMEEDFATGTRFTNIYF